MAGTSRCPGSLMARRLRTAISRDPSGLQCRPPNHGVRKRRFTYEIKVVGSAVAAAFALSVVVPGAALAQEKPQVLVWTDSVRQPGFEAYRDLVADEVDVKVEIQDINQVLGKIQLANQAGSGWPDVIFADPSDLALLVSPQIDYALEWTPELAGEGFLEDFGNGNIWCEIEGKTWCVKNDLAQTVLWYDTVVFEELGLTVPTTMEEWAATAMKLAGTGYVAGALGDEGFYSGYLWPSGCPLALPVSDTEVRINGQDPACTRVATSSSRWWTLASSTGAPTSTPASSPTSRSRARWR